MGKGNRSGDCGDPIQTKSIVPFTPYKVYVLVCEPNEDAWVAGVFSSIEAANEAIPLVNMHKNHEIQEFEINVI